MVGLKKALAEKGESNAVAAQYLNRVQETLSRRRSSHFEGMYTSLGEVTKAEWMKAQCAGGMDKLAKKYGVASVNDYVSNYSVVWKQHLGVASIASADPVGTYRGVSRASIQKPRFVQQ